jgi:hypothetical protein
MYPSAFIHLPLLISFVFPTVQHSRSAASCEILLHSVLRQIDLKSNCEHRKKIQLIHTPECYRFYMVYEIFYCGSTLFQWGRALESSCHENDHEGGAKAAKHSD